MNDSIGGSRRVLRAATRRRTHNARLHLGRAVSRLDARALVSLIVAGGLFGYVSYIADARGNGHRLWVIVEQTWVLILLLTLPYLAARVLVWSRLLRQLDVHVAPREVGVAFAGGEITKSFPGGIYVQNYLLRRQSGLGRLSLVRSTVATTATLGLECLVALPVALIVGLPGVSWLRPTLLGIVTAWLCVVVLAWLLLRSRPLLNSETGSWRRHLALVGGESVDAGRRLISRKSARQIVPTAFYMLVSATQLYAIIRAAGVHTIGFGSTMGIYAVLVLAVILIPIPTEFGLTEITGMGVFMVYGLPGATAAIIVVAFRLLATGATILLAGLLLILLHRRTTERGHPTVPTALPTPRGAAPRAEPARAARIPAGTTRGTLPCPRSLPIERGDR